jgi:DNA-binding MarR family transcriptional regulator
MEVAMQTDKDYDALFRVLLSTDNNAREWLLRLIDEIPKVRKVISEHYENHVLNHFVNELAGISTQEVDVRTLWCDDGALMRAQARYERLCKVYAYLQEHPYCGVRQIAQAIEVSNLGAHDALRLLIDKGLVDTARNKYGYRVYFPTNLAGKQQRPKRKSYRANLVRKILQALSEQPEMVVGELHKRVGYTWSMFSLNLFALVQMGAIDSSFDFVSRDDTVRLVDADKARAYIATLEAVGVAHD